MIDQTVPAVGGPALSSSDSNESTEQSFDVYLSYNSTDKEAIEPIVAELHKQGLTVFLDTEHITLGDSANSVIRKALRDARCVIVCLSKSRIGDWQRFEVESYVRTLPDEQGRQFFEGIVPVLLPGAPDPMDPATHWTTQRWFDFRDGFGDLELDQLVNAIKTRIANDR